MNTLNGYSKIKLTDDYILTAAGGHKNINNFIQTDSEMIKGAFGKIPEYVGESGWHRIATIDVGSFGYGSYILYLCGRWNNNANTTAIIHVNTMHTTSSLTQVSGIVGFIDKVRLVNISANNYYVDVHINYSANNIPGQVYFYFLGNGDISTNTTAEKITDSVTASSEISLTTIGKLGTVTSVAIANGGGIGISGSPITSSGTITLSNTGVRSLTIGTGDNKDKLAVNTNGSTSYLTVPYATTAGTSTNVTGTVAIANGGTGATSALAARTNLGLGAAAVKGVDTTVTSGSINLITSGGVYTKLAGYLPLTGGEITGNLSVTGKISTQGDITSTYGNITVSTGNIIVNHQGSGGSNIVYKNSRANSSGGGWADQIITIKGSSDNVLGYLGIHGQNSALNYIYLGQGNYDGNVLRIYSDKVTFGGNTILHSGNASVSGNTITINGKSTTWTNTTYNVVSSSANGLAPKFVAGGTIDNASNDYVLTSDNGTIGWRLLPANAFNNTTYSAMTGATSSKAGTSGLVPAPAINKHTSFLRGDGKWVIPTNTTYSAGNGLSLNSTTFSLSCTKATSDTDRPIVGTNMSNQIFYTEKAKINWVSGKITCGGLSSSNTINITGTSTDTARLIFSRTGASTQNYINWPGNSSESCLLAFGYSNSSASSYFYMSSKGFYPASNNTRRLGIDTNRWSYIYGVIGNFSSNVTITGTLSAQGGKFYTNTNGAYWTSDRRFKTNIHNPVKSGLLQDPTGYIRKFNWKDTGVTSYGYIAQELLSVIPEAVDYDENLNKYSVNYSVAHSAVIGQLVIKIKELEEEIKLLKAKFN